MKTLFIVLTICFTCVPALASKGGDPDKENPSMHGLRDTATAGISPDCKPCIVGAKSHYPASLKDHPDQADADRVRQEAQLQDTNGEDQVQ